MLVQHGIIGAFDRELLEHSRGCAGTAKYYKSTREAVLVQQSIIGALGRLWLESTIGILGRLCRYSRIGILRRLRWYRRVL